MEAFASEDIVIGYRWWNKRWPKFGLGARINAVELHAKFSALLR